MQFDRAKLRAVILHTCSSCPPDNLGAVKMHKVLYFLDMISYAQTGASVTGATYRKRPFGPTCVQLLPTLAEMERNGDLTINKVDFHGLIKHEYIARVSEQKGVLNEEERALLDEVIAFVCHRNSARTISEFSHKLPWEMAEFGEEIPYDTALLLYPSQPSPEAFDRVSEGSAEIEAARQGTSAVDLPVLSAFRSRVLSQLGGA
jgi:hypothetical protein